MKTIYFIDYERDILDIYTMLIKDEVAAEIKCLLSFRDKEFLPKAGDICIHELDGVGKIVKIPDVVYIVCTALPNREENSYRKLIDTKKMIKDVISFVNNA